jgi:hypothetical protein
MGGVASATRIYVKGNQEIQELKVTCSSLGISLRRPRATAVPPKTKACIAAAPGKAGRVARFSIQMRYKGQEHRTALPLTEDVIRQLAFEASFHNLDIGEFVTHVLVSAFQSGLLQDVLRD